MSSSIFCSFSCCCRSFSCSLAVFGFSFALLLVASFVVLRVLRRAASSSRRCSDSLVVEQLRRQVVDLQHFLAVERLLAGEVVVAGLELEVHEVGLGDEARLVDRRRAQRRRLAFLRALLVALGAVLATALLALDPVLLVGAPIGLGDRHAVELERTAHVDAVAHVPRVFAAHPRVRARGPGPSTSNDSTSSRT